MFVLLFSCSPKENNKTSDNLLNSSDSVLVNSVNNIKVCDTVQRVSDSFTQNKVGEVITKIKYLNSTVEKLRIEKQLLTKELKVSKQNVRIDTVFIETRKSFWGKEKKTIKTKSDAQSVETIDSTSTKQVLDSIN